MSKYTQAVDRIRLTHGELQQVLDAVHAEEQSPEPIKKKKHTLRKVLLTAAVIIATAVLGIGTASAVTGVNYFEEIYRFFDSAIRPDVIQSYDDAAMTSKGITVEVTDVIADGLYTMVRLDITDERMQDLLASYINDDDSAQDVWEVLASGVSAQLYDRFGIQYEYDNTQEVGYTDHDTIGVVLTFLGSPTSPCRMHLFIRSVNGVDGAWDVEFDVTPQMNERKYTCDTVFTFSNGTEVQITDIELYASRTVVKGKYLNFQADENHDYVIDSDEDGNIEQNTIFDCMLYADGKEYESRQLSTDYHEIEMQFEPVYGDFDTPELEIGFGKRLSEDNLNDEAIETQRLHLILISN